MLRMATKHLRLRRERDGYYRARWYDDHGQRHARSFGQSRAGAENEFSGFKQQWLNDPGIRNPGADGPLTVAAAWERFKVWAEAYYRHPDGTPTREHLNLADAFAVVLEMLGELPAADFGPAKLAQVQARLVGDGLVVNTINARVRKIRFVFRWLASQELVPGALPHALSTVLPVRPGRGVQAGPDLLMPEVSEPVCAVPDAIVWKTLEHLPTTIRAMIEFEYWTGCRPQDVCNLTGAALETTGAVWVYRPARHKTAWRGKHRLVLIGPKAQKAIKSFLSPNLAAPLFSPAKAMQERLGDRRAKYTPPEGAQGDYRNWPSYQARASRGIGRLKDRYTPTSYARAIADVCKEHGIQHWSPNQLRHNAATRMRKQFGLDVAQVVLGHADASTTEIYAAADLRKAAEAMEQAG